MSIFSQYRSDNSTYSIPKCSLLKLSRRVNTVPCFSYKKRMVPWVTLLTWKQFYSTHFTGILGSSFGYTCIMYTYIGLILLEKKNLKVVFELSFFIISPWIKEKTLHEYLLGKGHGPSFALCTRMLCSTNLVEIGWNWPCGFGEERKLSMHFHSVAIISPWQRITLSTWTNLNPLPCFVPNMVEIGTMILEENLKMWKILMTMTDTRVTFNQKSWLEPSNSGELNMN